MAEQSYSLEFNGYWRDENSGGLPTHSGVYCVYSCTFNIQDKKVAIDKLLYIGEAQNVRDRVASHEKRPDWQKHLSKSQQLCFSTAPVDSVSRERVEAAQIFKHKPPVNTEYVRSFPFDTTTISNAGAISSLNSHFKVYRTQ